MANTIKGFKINGVPHSLDAMFLSGATKEQLLASGGTSNPVLNGIYINPSSNLEINASVGGGEKLNLVASDAIQIKPGDGEPLQLDCEQNTVDLNEYGVKVCNGAMNKNARVVGLKLNAAELTLDTQKANTTEFDTQEFQVKFRHDIWNGGEEGIKDGKVVGPIYAKMKARAFDFRCYDHGGIALQIAGADSGGHENKIKFESDRTTEIGATPAYSKEGGKGLEFGTFNNEHTSLYTGDYRFKGDAAVYGVTRNTPVLDSKGKTDYPTQGDDFKDVINAATPNATWNEIIDAAKKCKNLDETIAAEVARAGLSGNVDASVFVTKSEVADVVASAVTDLHIDTTGLATEQWVLDKHYINSLPDGLQYVKIGSSKGNFAVDVTGKYTYEQTGPKSATTVDEFGNLLAKGDRVINYTNEAFYTNPAKVYYKAGADTLFADGTSARTDDIVYAPECNLTFNLPDGAYAAHELESGMTSFYEDENKFIYKSKIKNAPTFSGGTYSGNTVAKGVIINGADLSAEEVEFYDSYGAQYDEDGEVVVAAVWDKIALWKKSTLWSVNEINVNLETDSKIKFAGKKIETVWTVDDVDQKMDDILLSTNTLTTDANEVVFEQKISKNGDRSGQDTEFVYSFGNNVADTDKVVDFAAFKANYDSKHKNHGKTDAELQDMYDAFLAEGESFEVRVKVSELLGLVQRVADLEARVAALETQNTPEEPQVEPNE